MDNLESLRRREEQLGAIVDGIRFRPEHNSRTIDSVIRDCPEYRAAYEEWESAFNELTGHKDFPLKEYIRCCT